MTFQPGNQLGALTKPTPTKPYRDALWLEIKAAGDDHRALRLIAKAALKQAYKGEQWAVNHVAERIDGKVPQALVADEGGPIVLQVVRYVVQEGAQVIDITPAQHECDMPANTQPLQQVSDGDADK